MTRKQTIRASATIRKASITDALKSNGYDYNNMIEGCLYSNHGDS